MGVCHLKVLSAPVFSNNIASYDGGAVDCHSISFEGSSATVFSNNTASYDGGAVSCGSISFEGSSATVFSNNIARYGGGAVSCGSMSFEGSSAPVFSNNIASYDGGAVDCGSISFEGSSATVFSNNTARYGGGAVSCGNMSFEGSSATVFSSNIASYDGGAVDCHSISFEGSSATVFSNNTASYDGGAVDCRSISFEGSSVTVFSNNIARYDGGAVYSYSDVVYSDNSTVTFTNNNARNGAMVHSRNSKVKVIESSTIFINDHLVKWCNNTCLPYRGYTYGRWNVITIDINGVVWCTDQKAFLCLSTNCYCNELENLLDGLQHNTIVNITDNVTLSSVIDLRYFENISIIGHNNITVICGINGGGLYLYSCDNLIVKGFTWIGCGIINSTYNHRSVLKFYDSSGITIQNCTFQYSIGQVISLHRVDSYVNIDHCDFMNNNLHGDYHAVIDCYNVLTININNCNFSYNEDSRSIIDFSSSLDTSFANIYLTNSNYQNNEGTSIYLSGDNLILHINGELLFNGNTARKGAGVYICCKASVIFDKNSNVQFVSNTASYDGAAIYVDRYSSVIFDRNSNVQFVSNIASYDGAAIYVDRYSSVIFDKNSNVQFVSNIASYDGAAIYVDRYSSVIFDRNSNVQFVSNTASDSGAAICVSQYSSVTFEQSSVATFSDNKATSESDTVFGAAIYLYRYSSVIFEQNSVVTFINNKATVGTIYSAHNSNVTFTGTCQVMFSSNSATHYGSAIFSIDNSHITFTGNSAVIFSSNVVSPNNIFSQHGGTIFSKDNGYIAFEENSSVVFNNNIADFGAAIFSFWDSSTTFTGRSKVIFNNNIAQYCGALMSSLFSSITFNDNAEVAFNSNTVSYTLTDSFDSAAAASMCTFQRTDIMFSGYSLVKFTNNTAGGGGATVFCDSNVIIEEYSTVIFNNNIARYSFGAAFTCYNNSNVTFTGNSNVSFTGNKASQDGGAMYSCSMCKITTTGNSTSTFVNNTARNNGGAFFASDNSTITLTGDSVISFVNNEALQSGGAGYLNDHCNFIIEENAMVTFNDSKASHGGALCINKQTKLMFRKNSTTFFHNNLAIVSGGAIKVLTMSSIILNDYITVHFSNNNADYGSAVFLDTTAVMVNNSDKIHVKFTNNIAKILGSSIYQDVAELCNSSCVNHKVVGMNRELIAAPPKLLKLRDPAVCIDNDNDTQCSNYIVQNIMLGRKIIIPACMLDYYNQPIESTQFLIQGEMSPYYSISGPKQVVISCDTFEGITIVANQTLLKTPANFSISIALNTALYSNWKQISVNLTIELSPCPPGFWQYPESDKCECYSYNDAEEDIVFCSGSSSTIKRGYWFGSVTGKPTVTICPISYCNFACCEATNGYYHLSPVRDNQCRSHRSGTACGSCTDGYTLTFDSTKCVNINNCTAGHTVLVILLSIIYWVVMVTSVFAMMYYKVRIGYLYGITYYYSIVDILLSQNLYVNRGLHLTVSIMSSFSKITPRFLGDLCFTTGMSGIDQQFIHYIHPSAVLIILGIISLSARISRKISLFISRGIIHVICLLLLLSYTSIASTSLLLIRPLTFHGIDKVYTYLSPDIEYFHGRHAAYGIVALLCIISVVTGLPLLLTLEPFINHKFNFTKIKPLLDQFQGCYKDKYRCFAGYYMICRLVIITIVIANISNGFVANYILIVVCAITELIHVMVKPYNKELLNRLDTIILCLIILIATLSLSDDFDSPFVITIAVILVILPLLILIAITMFLHKHNLRKMIKHIERFAFKDESPSNNDVNKNEMPVREFNLVVDDSMRENNTIFDV